MKPHQLWRVVGIVLLALVACFIYSCAVNPVTGKRELMLLSEQEEIQLGIQTDRDIIQTYGLYPDTALENYISRLGKRMAAISHRPNLDYTFRLMDTPVINAFAVPGGFVYITRGILAYLNSEAELAGVMGHEIGHITARHSAKQYSKAQLAQIGLGIGTMVSPGFSRFAGLAQTGLGILFLKFSRDNERQSDQLGVEYATRVGYDAREMANFFVTMQRMTAEQKEGALPGWLSTHPNPAERVKTIHQLAEQWREKLGTPHLVIGREAYLKKIDGLVVGEDPRQGYVEAGVFYHPELRFQFPIPEGWRVNNTPAQVQLIAPKQNAAIELSLSNASSPAGAAAEFLKASGANQVSAKSLRVHGLPAYRLVSTLSTRQGELQILSYFIKYGPNLYAFHGYASKRDFATFSPLMEATMRGFARLTDRSKLNVKPDRIRIRKLPRRMTLSVALKHFGVRREFVKQLVFMNGREATDVLPAGTLIKVIEPGR